MAGAICSAITYLLARRVCPRGISIFAAILATIAGSAFRFLVLHNCYSTLLACLAVYAAVRFVENRSSYWAFATSSFTALTFLFEQSKGGGLGAGLLLGFVLLRMSGADFEQPSRLSAMGAGFAWPFVATFAYFGSKHVASEMVASWLWPLHHYTTANHVVYGWQNWSDNTRDIILRSGPVALRIAKVVAVSPGFLVPVLPIVAVALLIYQTVQLRKQSTNPQHASRYYVIVCSGMSGLLLSVVIVRPDVLHFMYLAPVWYVVLAWHSVRLSKAVRCGRLGRGLLLMLRRRSER